MTEKRSPIRDGEEGVVRYYALSEPRDGRVGLGIARVAFARSS